MRILDTIRAAFARFGRPRPTAAPLTEASMAPRRIRARYDAASSSDEYSNIWANADALDADSANSREVREKLRTRSRYEAGNNGFVDGISQTKSTHTIGVGPTLRMLSGSPGFNQMVEAEWNRWCKAVHFRRKLWTMAHAKHVDGEAFAVMRRNPGVKHTVKLDLVIYEAEQFQTPYIRYGEPGQIDGIRFDEFGNPVSYDLLRQHPGATNGVLAYDPEPEPVPAEYVLHWFKLRRPGQHRGVPECASTLNLGAAARRWREAELAAAETAAEHTVVLKTLFQPNEVQTISPMSTMDIQKRMMTALPAGWDMNQMEAKHPGASHESFNRSIINEMARPASMPFNVAACDSSSYNYASGRLDHQTYYGSLDVDREDCNDLVLDPLFDVWFDLCITFFGWLGGDPSAVTPAARAHLWDWPKHRVADVEAEANSNATRLKSGTVSLSRLYSEQGEDFEDKIIEMAADYGVTVDEMRELLRANLMPATPPGAAAPQAAPAEDAPKDTDVAAIAAATARIVLDALASHAVNGKPAIGVEHESHNGNGHHVLNRITGFASAPLTAEEIEARTYNRDRQGRFAPTGGGGGGGAGSGSPGKAQSNPSRSAGGGGGGGGGGGSSSGGAGDGTRPVRPEGKWKSDAEIQDHAKKMVEAHEADPHVRLLHTAKAQRQAAYDAADAKVKSAKTEQEKWDAIGERSKAKFEIERVDAALEHESRRSALQSFGVPVSQIARVEVDIGRQGHAAKNFEESQAYLRDMQSRDGAGDGTRVKVRSTSGRAHYDYGTIKTAKTDDPGVSAHEYGHHLERPKWVQEKVAKFREKRFDPKDDVDMSKEFPEHGYGKDERGNPDKMIDTFKGDRAAAAYAGKTYGHGMTEIVSMGVEQFYRDPVHFAKTDPEYFALTVSVLQGGGG